MTDKDKYEQLKKGLIEIYSTHGIDGICRDRRVGYLLHNLNIHMNKDLIAMEKYQE